MAISLRSYQQAIIDELRERLRNGAKSVLVQGPTGMGKTVIAAFMMDSLRSKGFRAWFACHRRELIRQTSLSFSKFGIDHAFIAAGFPADPRQLIQIAGVQTLANRHERLEKPKVILWDECHHISAGSWSAIRRGQPEAIHIGLSATPERLDGQGLDEHFETMILGPTVRSLIDQGSLCPYRLFAPAGVDLSSVHTVAGDYNRGELSTAMDKPAITGDVVAHYQRLCSGKRAVAFCASIQHSEHVAQAFRDAGIPAAHVDGETEPSLRDLRMREFAEGKILVLTNVDIAGEGVDIPGIEAVILLRPTQSLSLHLQQVGRGLRPAPGKTEAIILDHAGNSGRHGLPDDDRTWTLQGRKKRKKKSDDATPVRTCKRCFAALNIAVKSCPFCGAPVEIQAREVEHRDGELEEVRRREGIIARKIEQRRAETLDELIALGRSRGYRRPELWGRAVMRYRQQRAMQKGHANE